MFNYKELDRVAKKYYPRERGYCAVIALSVAAQIPFGKARSLLYKKGRKEGRGTPSVWTHNTIRELGYSVIMDDDVYNWPKTLATATRKLPKRGTFLVHTRGHISCVRDGVLEDWAADNGSRKRVLYVYKVKKARK